tara:strand:+ start:2341 stop:2826 length:486 start_codon:yes stop_codon:yes gene_type:complete
MIEYQGHNIKNVTLENLYKLLKDVAGANLLVSTTTIGDIFEVDLVETSYPLLHIGTSSASYGLNTLTYSFQLIVMDLVDKDEANEEEVLSDTLQIIGDILSAIRYTNATEYTDFLHVVRIDDNISCEPFTERFDNEVSGWTATINIEVDFDASACSGQIPT